MSYTITLTNGNILTTVPDTQLIGTYAGLELIGARYPSFGTPLNTDLVHMTEHFADTIPPANPLVGQLWYDTVSQSLNFWTGNAFNPISVVTNSATAPLNPQEGDEWYDNVNQQLFIWNGASWILIGPQANSGTAEGLVVEAFTPEFGNTVYYLNWYANNQLIGVVSGVELTNPQINGFGNIRPGINFVTNPQNSPPIVDAGIYNLNILTIGSQGDVITIVPDNYDNALYLTNGQSTMVATNGNAASNVAAHNYLTSGNIGGSVYFNQIFANTVIGGSYVGLSTPGQTGQIIFNQNGNLAGASDLYYDNSNGEVIANSSISSPLGTFTTLNSTDSTITSLTVTNLTTTSTSEFEGACTFSTASTFNAGITVNGSGNFGTLDVSGNFQVAGSTVLENASVNDLTATNANINTLLKAQSEQIGNSEITSLVAINANVTNLIVDDTCAINDGMTVTGTASFQAVNTSGLLNASGGLQVDGTSTLETTQASTLNVSGESTLAGVTAASLTVSGSTITDGPVTFNGGGSNEFVLPSTKGSESGGALCTYANGSTYWGNVPVNNWNAALQTNGSQVLPSGLIMQWGIVEMPGSSESDNPTNFNFNTPFPTACLMCIAGSYGPADRITFIKSFNSSGGVVSNNGSGMEAIYFAIGF